MATFNVTQTGGQRITTTALRDLSHDLSIDFAYIRGLCEILSDIDSVDDKVGALADAISLIAERAEGKVETAATEARHG